MKRPRKVSYDACHMCAGPINRTDHMAAFCMPCLRIAERVKATAHYAVKRLVVTGKLPPAANFACTDCDGPARCYDHRDYSKPHAVEPVCNSCNIRRGPGIYPQPQASAA